MAAMRTMGLAPVLPPDTMVTETRNEYVVSLAVPGFTREELEVELADRTLTVRGDQARTEPDDDSFQLHEKIEDSFRVPPDTVTDRITARYRHGTLEIRAPRGASHQSSSPEVKKVPIAVRRLWNLEASGV